MKLLFCSDCHDVVKLDYETRLCKCGAVCGYYNSDGSTATVSPNAIVIGISNQTLETATRAFKAARDCGIGEDAGHRTLAAWVMGLDAPRVTWEGRKKARK